MKYYIYIAKENSYNEGQGFKSLNLLAERDSWEEAYEIMKQEGDILRAKGWREGSCSRSEGYCNDVWLENDHGQDWKDWHQIQFIASTSKLRLAVVGDK